MSTQNELQLEQQTSLAALDNKPEWWTTLYQVITDLTGTKQTWRGSYNTLRNAVHEKTGERYVPATIGAAVEQLEQFGLLTKKGRSGIHGVTIKLTKQSAANTINAAPQTATRGGARPGAGRKKIDPDMDTVNVSLRLSEGQKAIFDAIDGTNWLRQQLDHIKRLSAIAHIQTSQL